MPNGSSAVLFLLGCNSLSFETTLGSLASLGCSVTYWLQWQDQTSWLLQQNLESAGSVITNRTKSSSRVTQLSWIGRVPQQPQKAHLILQCMFLLLPPLNELNINILISFFVCLFHFVFVFCRIRFLISKQENSMAVPLGSKAFFNSLNRKPQVLTKVTLM